MQGRFPETEPEARWNAVRCDPRRQAGHVESYFLKLNDREGRRALWIKATILVRAGGSSHVRSAVAEAWAIAFDREGRHRAAKETVPLAQASFDATKLDVSVADLRLRDRRVSGEVTSGDTRIAFELTFTGASAPLVPFFTARMYEGRLPSSKIVSPHPDVVFRGFYEVDGERVEVDGWRGMQGHNWGTRHAELYAWGHCNEWEGADSLVLEGFTGRVKVGPVLAPPLTILCVRHRGVRYDFNGPLAMLRARGSIDLHRWTFSAKNALAAISGELWADSRDFVGLAYENPSGETTYCLNSKIARGRIRLSVRGSRRGNVEVEAMTRGAALEIGTKNPHHGVTMLA